MSPQKFQERKEFFSKLDADHAQFGHRVSRRDILTFSKNSGSKVPHWFLNDLVFRDPENSSLYIIPEEYLAKENEITMDDTEEFVEELDDLLSEDIVLQTQETFIPRKTKGYVKFGNYEDLKTISSSKLFYPVFITGLSGNGKTLMVHEVIAEQARELLRVNITYETDEDDLIGGFRLINGETVWHDGPVIVAMERGATLLLDEIDLGTAKLMCLQPVLEGNGIYIKKINKYVHPKPGFNIIATANTKGQGSMDGRFVGTNILNEAFLERFSITMEQDYPSKNVEAEIVRYIFKASIPKDFYKEQEEQIKNFGDILVDWASVIRGTYKSGAVSELVSTRRLVHICQAFAIFQDKEKAIRLCLNRFDEDTKKSFMDLYAKLDEKYEAALRHKLNAAQKQNGESTKAVSYDPWATEFQNIANPTQLGKQVGNGNILSGISLTSGPVQVDVDTFDLDTKSLVKDDYLPF